MSLCSVVEDHHQRGFPRRHQTRSLSASQNVERSQAQLLTRFFPRFEPAPAKIRSQNTGPRFRQTRMAVEAEQLQAPRSIVVKSIEPRAGAVFCCDATQNLVTR